MIVMLPGVGREPGTEDRREAGEGEKWLSGRECYSGENGEWRAAQFSGVARRRHGVGAGTEEEWRRRRQELTGDGRRGDGTEMKGEVAKRR